MTSYSAGTNKGLNVNYHFENFIYCLILLSMIVLVLDNPANDPRSSITAIIAKIDFWIVIVFNIEAICRIIAQGFFTCSVPN